MFLESSHAAKHCGRRSDFRASGLELALLVGQFQSTQRPALGQERQEGHEKNGILLKIPVTTS